MEENPESYPVAGDEKGSYLKRLDNALNVLAKNLSTIRGDAQDAVLKAFGEQNDWDWTRLPKQRDSYRATYNALSALVQRVRKEYGWFDWIYSSENPENNHGYFDELNISAESGLPWVFDLIELHRLRKDAEALLEKMPSYKDSAVELRKLLLEDYVEIDDIGAKANDIHKSAMQRNFIEHLKDAELLSWESTDFSMKPRVTKIMPLGVESLWNLVFIKYSRASSMFQLYSIDLWQDIREPHIIENASGIGEISGELSGSLTFGDETAAWYILKTIDERFTSLHPVHVSRALIGPFENRYLTKPDAIKPLGITQELLKDDKEAALLRFSRQYAYAPNHEAVGDRVQQVIYRENWNDEFIVCPAKYSPSVSKSVLGTSVRIFEV